MLSGVSVTLSLLIRSVVASTVGGMVTFATGG